VPMLIQDARMAVCYIGYCGIAFEESDNVNHFITRVSVVETSSLFNQDLTMLQSPRS
jgi:hypothetical protein